MNQILDTLSCEYLHMPPQEGQSASNQAQSSLEQNILLPSLDVNNMMSLDQLHQNSHQTMNTFLTSDIILASLRNGYKTENQTLSQESFISQQGLFTVSAGKRSPPVIRENPPPSINFSCRQRIEMIDQQYKSFIDNS